MTMNPRSRSTRPALGAGATLVLVIAAACTPAAAPSPSPSAAPGSSGAPTTSPSPTASPVADGISHATGTADVLLRIESGGGMIAGSFATAIPSFTLYGDGTVVFRDPSAAPPAGESNVTRLSPFLTIRLDEEGIQALLAEAIGRGGLGIATGPYMGQGADLPSTIFRITADGSTKEVSVTPLSPEMHPQDVAIVTQLAALAQRLDGFAALVAGEQVYEPAAYRGILMSVDQPFGPVLDWPWATIKPEEFVSGDNDFVKVRTLTPADVTTLGVPNVQGGLTGLTLKAADGKLYSLSLRPLLPDESK